MNKNLCTIYIIRHGESEANQQDRYGLDTGLTEKGRVQAKNVAKRFHKTHFDVIFSSPLVRAKETAEIIRAERKLEVLTNDALKERNYGILEGRQGEEVKDELKEIYQRRENAKYQESKSIKIVEGYETDEEVISRFITQLREIAIAYSEKTVLITSHVGVMKILLIHLGIYNRKQLHGASFENTGYIKLQSDGVDFFVQETNGLTVHRI